MSDIRLTSSMRSNLLSLQNTQGLFDQTQNRLSTGSKVNSALDNPSSFFTAQALTNRANDLNTLMDAMGQATSTLNAADEGITTLTDLVEQAKSLVNSARDTANVASTTTGSIMMTAAMLATSIAGIDSNEAFTIRTGDATSLTGTVSIQKDQTIEDAGLLKGDKLIIKVGEEDWASVATTTITQTVEQYLKSIEAAVDNVSASLENGRLVLKSTDNSAISVKVGSTTTSDVANNLGLDLGKTITITAAAKVSSVIASINAITGLSAELNDDGYLKISKTNGDDMVIVDKTGNAAETLGIDGAATNGSNERAGYSKQYDALLKQIDDLVTNGDTGYKGINLLNGDDLSVTFNESRTSKLNIQGVKFNSSGLGLNKSENDWLNNSDIQKSVENVDTALSRLRTQASEFGQNLSVVETRSDFTNNMIDTLTSGADKLTLADMNEESANMLALQTRQQLGTKALSLASQASQSVLSLF